MGVLGERAPLGVSERATELGLDLVEEATIAKAPGELTAHRGHRHARSSRDDRGGFLERGQVRGPGVTVGHEDEAEAGAGQRQAVVDDRVAHDALAHGHRARRLERERAEVERRCQHGVPARPRGHQARGDLGGEVPRGERVDAERQVWAVLLERAHGEDHDRACALEGGERGGRQLFQCVHAQNELPRVDAR